jgi:hypothetical protein
MPEKGEGKRAREAARKARSRSAARSGSAPPCSGLAAALLPPPEDLMEDADPLSPLMIYAASGTAAAAAPAAQQQLGGSAAVPPEWQRCNFGGAPLLQLPSAGGAAAGAAQQGLWLPGSRAPPRQLPAASGAARAAQGLWLGGAASAALPAAAAPLSCSGFSPREKRAVREGMLCEDLFGRDLGEDAEAQSGDEGMDEGLWEAPSALPLPAGQLHWLDAHNVGGSAGPAARGSVRREAQRGGGSREVLARSLSPGAWV